MCFLLCRRGGETRINCDGCSFLTPHIAQKYDLDVPEYEGMDQILELGQEGRSS